MSLSIPPRSHIQPIPKCPEDGAVDQVERERDAAQVLVEAIFEEGFQPTDAWDGGYYEEGGEEEEEPFEIPGCLGDEGA